MGSEKEWIGFYSGNSYLEPAFYNPIPWKLIPMPRPLKEVKDLSGKKDRGRDKPATWGILSGRA